MNERRGGISFFAEGPLQQFQIDKIWQPKSWFNNGFECIFYCIDVFSKKAERYDTIERLKSKKQPQKHLENIK